MLSEKGNKQTSELLSYCGLICNTCPIYLVTREADTEEQARKRIEIAGICKEQYGMPYEISDITDCDGCRMEGGRLFSGCTDCAIRACATRKTIENCASCSEYICQKLDSFFAKDPDAKIRLDEARKNILK